MSLYSIGKTRAGSLTAAIILFSGFAVLSFAERKPAFPQTSRVTFSHDIAPIVFRSCAPCHHAGEAGPFPLITYGDVKSHARQIADVTSKPLMPPWLPSQDGLRLEDDSHLSGDEIALFEKWVGDGTAEGNRHHIENNPGDFEAHYNLAAMLQLRGATQEAVEQYQRALTLRPADATVENALGGALLASHRIPEAIAHLTAAASARPEYFDAHYNLGIAQAIAGNFPAAVQELTAAVKLKPDDAGAEANLGAAFAELGETQKAITHLNRALQLDPGNELARENLEALRGASSQP